MRFWILLLIALATLALFNPDEADFAEFARERAQDTVSDQARDVGGGLFGAVGGALAGTLAGALVNHSAERDNYFVASHYTLDFDGPEQTGQEWTFLGVAGQFIELNKPAVLE